MSTLAVTRRRFLHGLGGTAALLSAPRLASGAAVTPFKLEVDKIDVYGTRDPQLMAMPSLAEVSGYFKDEGLTETPVQNARAWPAERVIASARSRSSVAGFSPSRARRSTMTREPRM